MVALAPLLLIAARCIDNETLYQDASGDWHIVGEMHNETDIQGAGMVLGGTLFDAEGNVLDTTQVAACPMELSPHSFIGFDLHFQYAGSRPARYEVRAVNGRALEQALPDSGLGLQDFEAASASDGLRIGGTVTSTRTYTGILTGCVAVYDSAGRVITHFTLINFGLNSPLTAGEPQPVMFTLPTSMVEPGGTAVRLWLAGDSATPLESDYAFVMTDSIPIQ
ncbi:MAG: hypothetical protein HY873_12915 [Chloroflexi bacterium]|nr:hypothetical protein [Chloroflexota bacterium]